MATLPNSLPRVKKTFRPKTGDGSRPIPANPLAKTASIAEAKATLSSLVNSVVTGRSEITLLRRGVAVAKIVPIRTSKLVSGYGWMRGSAHEKGDIVGPTGEEWTANDE